MTREQAINYLISSGFTHEQVGEVVRALTYEPARLSVPEVTALAEWTERLTKASEDAYNKGYADGMKALEQEPTTKNELGVLDKLRVEIEQNAYPIVYGINNHELGMTLYGILQVIDKYKTESEE